MYSIHVLICGCSVCFQVVFLTQNNAVGKIMCTYLLVAKNALCVWQKLTNYGANWYPFTIPLSNTFIFRGQLYNTSFICFLLLYQPWWSGKLTVRKDNWETELYLEKEHFNIYNNKCKGSEVGTYLAPLRSSKDARGVGGGARMTSQRGGSLVAWWVQRL